MSLTFRRQTTFTVATSSPKDPLSSRIYGASRHESGFLGWLTWSRAMLRNEELYPEQDLFKPERFLNDDGSFNESVLDPEEVTFGFGRRYDSPLSTLRHHRSQALICVPCIIGYVQGRI